MTGEGSSRGAHGGPGLEVWAVEAYFGGSHEHFLKGLMRNSHHRIAAFTLPGRFWKWRMHGGALTLGRQVAERRLSEGSASPDVFFVSDMVDLPVFRATAGPWSAAVPAILYFHENQLTYPLPPGVERDLGYGMQNVTSALAADTVLFNTHSHRRDFLEAVGALLGNMPDEIPSWVPGVLEARSRVLPVGCDLRRFDRHHDAALEEAAAGRWGDRSRGPLIVWNQRWEYDKAPGDLFEGLYALKARGRDFRLAIAGSNQGTPTAEFLRAFEELSDHIVQWGRVETEDDYASLLWGADVVVSTAIHEFFGISVVEAMYCGCRPVLPHRLSYPEIVPADAHEDVLYREGGLVGALERALARPDAWSEDWQRTWVARYDWASLASRYDEEIRRCRERAAVGARHEWSDSPEGGAT